jgi:hypothetical protein
VKSPWESIQTLEGDREYFVLASSIPPLRRSSTGRMFRGAPAVRRQLAGTEGAVGFALLARPWRKQYATLSIWVDEPALAMFTGESPHRELMTKLAPEMGPTKFARWTINGSDGVPSWAEALRRLG